MFGLSADVFYLLFIRSVGVGFFLALCFGLLIFLRKIGLRNKYFVFFQDLFYSAFAAVVSFVFVFESNGGVPRVYIFFGEAVGFLLFFLYKLPVK